MATDTYVNTATTTIATEPYAPSIATHLTPSQAADRTSRMEPGIKAQWLSALRSGDYKQGQGKLAKAVEGGEKQYCCLGVLCDIAIRNKVPSLSAEQKPGSTFITFSDGYYSDHSMPPLPFQQWAKLPTRDPLIPISAVHAYQAANPDAPLAGSRDSKDGWTTLATLNDRGFSFAFIADMIEKYL